MVNENDNDNEDVYDSWSEGGDDTDSDSVYDKCDCSAECNCYTKHNAIQHELKMLKLDHSTHFNYCVNELPSDIFSDDKMLIFSLTHSCYCYANCPSMKQRILYVYVTAKSYAMGERITYGKIFYEIEKQVKEQYKELSEKYELELDQFYCNHRFIEGFDKKTPIHYDIFCGS